MMAFILLVHFPRAADAAPAAPAAAAGEPVLMSAAGHEACDGLPADSGHALRWADPGRTEGRSRVGLGHAAVRH